MLEIEDWTALSYLLGLLIHGLEWQRAIRQTDQDGWSFGWTHRVVYPTAPSPSITTCTGSSGRYRTTSGTPCSATKSSPGWPSSRYSCPAVHPTPECWVLFQSDGKAGIKVVPPAQYSDETLAVFKSFKLDDMQASKRKLEELRTSAGEHVYFAKFLTSEKVGLVDCSPKRSACGFSRRAMWDVLIMFSNWSHLHVTAKLLLFSSLKIVYLKHLFYKWFL